jgi:outer membrane protein TolC
MEREFDFWRMPRINLLLMVAVCPVWLGVALGQEPLRPLVKFGTPQVAAPESSIPKSFPSVGDRQILPQPQKTPSTSPPAWSSAQAAPGEEIYPISLPNALKLANARAWDISIAQRQLQIAVAQHDGAKAMWIPSLIGGAAYAHHDGPIQANDGSVTDSSRSSLFAGIAPLAYYNVTDAVFTPLAKRQEARAQSAGVQTVTNDTLTAVAVAYFDAQEARADLASIEEIARLMAILVRKTEKLAPELAPEVELARVRALQKNIEQARITARMQWRVVSAELARVLRLPPAVIVQPIEPPDLRMTLIPLTATPEEMIPLAQRLRPELTQYQAQVAAAEERLRQERFRPFLPNIAVRGGSTPTAYPLGAGGFAAGQGGSLGSMGLRSDWDLEAIWELKNLGFGNAALIRERRAAVDLARDQHFRFHDYVAKEVMQSWAQLRAADERAVAAEGELQQAWLSATKNLEGLGETKRPAGNIVILVIRPQEVTAAMQALVQAYYNYYGVTAEFNRAQFRLYRALGNPAQFVFDNANPPCESPPVQRLHAGEVSRLPVEGAK